MKVEDLERKPPEKRREISGYRPARAGTRRADYSRRRAQSGLCSDGGGGYARRRGRGRRA